MRKRKTRYQKKVLKGLAKQADFAVGGPYKRLTRKVRRERKWLGKQSKARSMRTGKPGAALIRAFTLGRRVSKQR